MEAISEIVNQSPAVVFIWKNEEGWPIEYVSSNAENIFGYSKEEFLSSSFSYGKLIHPDDIERIIADVASYSNQSKGDYIDQEYRIITKNGNVVWLDHRTLIFRNSNGSINYFQGIVIDISERKRLAEERERLIVELQNALDEVKTLRGMIPICMHCKQIRDDKGSWTQLEKYIARHSEAEFTHGICESCLKKHYSEYI